jgi:hypothetical protein
MKVKLKKDVKPFQFTYLGKVYKIPKDEIPEKFYKSMKDRVIKEKKNGEEIQ